MTPQEITAETLLLDESFQNWVTHSNQADIDYWETWIAEHPGQKAMVQEATLMIRYLYAGQKREVSDAQINRAIQVVTNRINENNQLQPEHKQKKVILLGKPYPWQKVAAVWIGILLLSFAGYWGVNQIFNPYHIYHTEADKTQSLQLPDGSQVVLNAHSSLRYTKNWDRDSVREVWLDGEGYFDVKHFSKPERRFIVHTSGVDIEVLGTTFNVWQRDKQTKVVLQTGKVRLNGKKLVQPVWMVPGEIVELEEHSQIVRPQIVRRRVDPQLYTSWRENRIVFDETPMPEVASFIEVRYRYQVQFADQAARQETITYKSSEDNFQTLLVVLEESFRVQVDHTTKKIVISSYD